MVLLDYRQRMQATGLSAAKSELESQLEVLKAWCIDLRLERRRLEDRLMIKHSSDAHLSDVIDDRSRLESAVQGLADEKAILSVQVTALQSTLAELNASKVC
jgi:hypothetical protein